MRRREDEMLAQAERLTNTFPVRASRFAARPPAPTRGTAVTQSRSAAMDG